VVLVVVVKFALLAVFTPVNVTGTALGAVLFVIGVAVIARLALFTPVRITLAAVFAVGAVVLFFLFLVLNWKCQPGGGATAEMEVPSVVAVKRDIGVQLHPSAELFVPLAVAAEWTRRQDARPLTHRAGAAPAGEELVGVVLRSIE
jgi:hypothetical protein